MNMSRLHIWVAHASDPDQGLFAFQAAAQFTAVVRQLGCFQKSPGYICSKALQINCSDSV